MCCFDDDAEKERGNKKKVSFFALLCVIVCPFLVISLRLLCAINNRVVEVLCCLEISSEVTECYELFYGVSLLPLFRSLAIAFCAMTQRKILVKFCWLSMGKKKELNRVDSPKSKMS